MTTPRATPEATVQADIRLDLGKEPTVRLFRNNRGEAWMGKAIAKTVDTVTLLQPRRVNFGLTAGASDLIGLRQVVITPDMVGQAVAIFAAVEVKPRKGGVVTEEQTKFVEFVNRFGGMAGVARSPEQARLVLRLGADRA